MVLVDGDVTSDVVDFYMTWIACMLREIELTTLSGVHLYWLYIYIYRLITPPNYKDILKGKKVAFKSL